MTGYADDVVTGNLEDENKDVDYYFGNCVLRTVEAEDDASRFVGVVYEKKDEEGSGQEQFRLFDTDNYLYDFRLKDNSIARGKGSTEWAARYPTDRYGTDRLTEPVPDAGCYEFVPEE